MRYKLTSKSDSPIHIGTFRECKLILKGLTAYGISADKFDITECKEEEFLSDDIRDKVIKALLDHELTCAFGDGQEEDMVLDGMNSPGLYHLSDEHLIELLEQIVDLDSALLHKAQCEFEIHNALKQ